MNMVDLVLTVCLLSNPANCREEHLYFEFSGSLVRCMFMAQPEIAKWSGSHPDKKVVRWECKYPEKDENI
jgi:hypothetical protein